MRTQAYRRKISIWGQRLLKKRKKLRLTPGGKQVLGLRGNQRKKQREGSRNHKAQERVGNRVLRKNRGHKGTQDDEKVSKTGVYATKVAAAGARKNRSRE